MTRGVPRRRRGLTLRADGGDSTVRTTLRRPVAAVARAAGPGECSHLHHLRHGQVSWLDAGGVPFTTVVELLGHAPQGVTWSTCTRRADRRDRQVRDVLEQARNGKAADPCGPCADCRGLVAL